jgi:hypothetical protein
MALAVSHAQRSFVISDSKRIIKTLAKDEKEALDDIKSLTTKLQGLEREAKTNQSNLQSFYKRVGAA